MFRLRPLGRVANMSTATTATTAMPLEGLIAVNKPSGITSADVLRELQRLFKPSPIFASSLAAQKSKIEAESHTQRRRRRPKKRQLEVKMGHGGTLDPMASGVLVTGIYGGTKHLQKFLNSTKTYEATALLGCETDSYDSQGKILRCAEWAHVTREDVESALEKFRGDIMQKPPIYSALHHEGKRYYEYAREGKPLPVEIQARPVRADAMELLDFTVEHGYEFPKEEASAEEKVVSEALEKQDGAATAAPETNPSESAAAPATEQPAKEEPAKEETSDPKRPRSPSPESEPAQKKQKQESPSAAPDTTDAPPAPSAPPAPKPPAITLRMTVTSGFYVRSLIHDLGQALGSAAHMVKLVRTRQGEFELGGENTFEWDELMQDPEKKWEGKVERSLKGWMEKQSAGA